VTFLLSVSPPATFDWEAASLAGIEHELNPGGGGWLVTATLPAGSSSADIVIPTIDDPGFQGDRAVTISEVDVNGGALNDYVSVDGTLEFTYTVQDPTSFNLADGDRFDGSASEHGLEVHGSGENEIIGSAHGDDIHAGDGGSTIHGGDGDDTIHAGQGDDTLFGGAGSDTFTWEGDKLGGSDTIMDFDFNYQWNNDGTLNPIAGMDNDKIQLNIDFQELMGEEYNSLDALLADLHQSGDSAFSSTCGGFTVEFTSDKQLQIAFKGIDGGVEQTITVNSTNAFYNNAESLNDTQAVAILQQILINTNS
jgi:Ca2+-binding RTX toxin-like protein